jgi:nucleotide sugar dehydrogenase
MTLNMSMPGTMGGAKIVFKNQIMMTKVGIVGAGFVGSAIASAMEQGFCELTIVDPAKGYNKTYQDLLDCDGVFVCVPSPQDDDGTCDTSILEDVLVNLSKINYQGVIISKCTAPPDVYEQLNDLYPNLVHAPEFLTAANAVQDYVNGRFAMIGGRVGIYQREAERLIRIGQGLLGENVVHCTIGEASLAKYTINCFMSTKVIFMNELYQLAQAMNLNYDKIAAMVKMDRRIGSSHLQVPGPDGAFGFGGACFPKDTSAMLKFAEQYDVALNVLDAAVKKNTLLRLTESK